MLKSESSSSSSSSSSSNSDNSSAKAKVKQTTSKGKECRKSGKSSSEILNELFGTFNTSFDESEALNQSHSVPESRKSKHAKKSTQSLRKKKKTRDTEKEKLKKTDTSKSKVTLEKEKNRKHKTPKRIEKSPSPVTPPETKKNDTTPPVSKYPTIKFKGKTIVLDVEEGEITEAAEKRAERKKHLRKRESHEAKRSSKKKEQNSDESSTDDDSESEKSFSKYRSSSSRHERKNSRHEKHESRQKSYNSRSSSSKRRNSYDSRSRSKSQSPRSRRSSQSNRRDSSSFRSFRWEKTRDRSLEKTRRNAVRRVSVYDDDTKRYNGSGGSFGYSGSLSRYEGNYYDYRRRVSGSSSRYSRKSRSRSRSTSRSKSSTKSHRESSTLRRLHPDDIIEKTTLLEIARKNAAKLMRQGVLPTDIFSRDQILAIKAGGKSVEELTEYCKRVAKRDSLGEAEDGSSDEEHLIHHPFTVKDRPMPSITMNIRNAISLPIRSAQELAIENAKLKVQFPVSSGTQHRHKELEWKSVDKDEVKEKEKVEKKKEDLSKALIPLNVVAPMTHETEKEVIEKEKEKTPTKEVVKEITLDPKPATLLDIGTVISKRLQAMKELQDNPDDVTAKERLENATAEMKEWAEAKALEPKFLTPAELLTGPQAWAKKDQLKTASAVQGGMGMHLLQRMGWNPGEGLGKNNEGSTEPLALDIKTDKKGLASVSDHKGPSLPTVFDLSGKHPVSSLMELCAKRRWGDPVFLLCFEHGPAHKRNFVYKVTVNGVEYQPCVATKNKKEAKANAAAFCLQSLGLLPIPKTSTTPPQAATMLKTVPDNIPKTSPVIQKAVDNVLMPPPPPPLELAKLVNPPLPLSSPIPAPAPPVSNPTSSVQPPPPVKPPPCPPSSQHPKSLMAMKLMSMAGIPFKEEGMEEDELLVTPPIIQVPLPPASIGGYPGLTTF